MSGPGNAGSGASGPLSAGPAGIEAAMLPGERRELQEPQSGSPQRRITNYLTLVFGGLLTLAAFGWYYSSLAAHNASSRAKARAPSLAHEAAETRLPPIRVTQPQLARVEAPLPRAPASSASAPAQSGLPEVAATSSVLAEAPLPLPVSGPLELPPGPLAGTPSTPAGSPPAAVRGALERRLAGPVFATRDSAPPESVPSPAGSPGGAGPPGELGVALVPTATPPVPARRLPTRDLLLPKGAFIDCTLETAIDSSLPGLTTCITATDTFGADGRVVLLERGTKLVGETRGQVRQGSARVFVLWTEARTPTGVIVPLDSPATDEIGRAGLPGAVDRHFWERFGAAILISLVDGGVSYGVSSAGRGNSTLVYGPGASQGIVTEVLKDTVAIPPTVTKRNGDRIQVLVARDVDFRSVYELRARPHP